MSAEHAIEDAAYDRDAKCRSYLECRDGDARCKPGMTLINAADHGPNDGRHNDAEPDPGANQSYAQAQRQKARNSQRHGAKAKNLQCKAER